MRSTLFCDSWVEKVALRWDTFTSGVSRGAAAAIWSLNPRASRGVGCTTEFVHLLVTCRGFGRKGIASTKHAQQSSPVLIALMATQRSSRMLV